MEDLRSARIEAKLDKIAEQLGDIKADIASQKAKEEDVARRMGILEDRVEPIQKHVNRVEGVAKALGLLSVVGIIAESIIQVLHYVGAK